MPKSMAYQPNFSSLIKAKLINRFKENLMNSLNQCKEMNQGKLRTYALFKTIFQKEKYLSVIQDVYIRKCFMAFRISSHRLEIERGRYKNLPIEKRLCTFCSSDSVEDEKHLLFNCSLYTSLRQIIYAEVQKSCKHFSSLSQEAQLIWLMTNESDDIILLFSKYIYDCFLHRGVYFK